MTNESLNLKPCPFGKGKLYKSKSQYGHYIKVKDEIGDEVYRSPYFCSEERLVDFWNSRAYVEEDRIPYQTGGVKAGIAVMGDAGCKAARADSSHNINAIDMPVADKQQISAQASETLIDCPFCGGKAEEYGDTLEGYGIQCKKCGCATPQYNDGLYQDSHQRNKPKAIEIWNKRVSQSEISSNTDMSETELPRRKLLEMCDSAQKMALERGDRLFKANQRIHELEQELRQKREIVDLENNAEHHKSALVSNLAMLVRRLCHRINNAPYQHDRDVKTVKQAQEFLRANNLQGSPLRNKDIQECE